jgi:hypothetical protein
MCVVVPRILARETRCASPVASLSACDAPSAFSLVASLNRAPVSSADQKGRSCPSRHPPRPSVCALWTRDQKRLPPLDTCTMYPPMETAKGALATPLETSVSSFLRFVPSHSIDLSTTSSPRRDRRPKASGLDVGASSSIREKLFGTKECSLASGGSNKGILIPQKGTMIG